MSSKICKTQTCMWLHPPFFSMQMLHFGQSCKKYDNENKRPILSYLCVSRDVIGSFTIIGALCQPPAELQLWPDLLDFYRFKIVQIWWKTAPFDCVTVSGRMVRVPTFEAKSDNFYLIQVHHTFNNTQIVWNNICLFDLKMLLSK